MSKLFLPDCRLALIVSAALLLLIVCSSSAVGQQHDDTAEQVAPASTNPQKSARSQFQLPRLFDFEFYKTTFRKMYSSALEESIRRKYMLARAMRAFVSAIKYKLGQISSFSALNLFSDRMPAEMERMVNKKLQEEVDEIRQRRAAQEGAASSSNDSETDQQLTEDLLPDFDPDEAEQRLAQLKSGDVSAFQDGTQSQADLDEVRAELEKQKDGKLSRRKRELRRRAAARKELSMDKLISTGDDVELDQETRKKVDLRPEGNNPDYRQPELASFGLRDEKWVKVNWRDIELDSRRLETKRKQKLAKRVAELKERKGVDVLAPANPTPWDRWASGVAGMIKERMPPELANHYLVKKGQEFIMGLNNKKADEIEQLLKQHGVDVDVEAEEPDEVFLDHRDSNCLFLPRQQGNCGSCYAFAVTALAEFLHCKKTGKLVAFSEQYMIDCGRTTKLDGCDGGFISKAAHFIHNFGVELRPHYPYLAREQECPYDENTHPKEMGFIRMDLGSIVTLPMEFIDEHLHLSPVVLAIHSPKSFHDYGGGVWKGEDCIAGETTHATLVVGHGREDGLEYWLVRNSHSVGWGEQGHIKIWKKSLCVNEYGFFFGTRDLQRISMMPKQNFKNKKNKVINRYEKNLEVSLEEEA